MKYVGPLSVLRLRPCPACQIPYAEHTPQARRDCLARLLGEEYVAALEAREEADRRITGGELP